jgi:hypothetical protein
MILTASELAILRQRPYRTDLFLSIYKPTVLMQCKVNDPTITRGAITGTYDSVTIGSWADVDDDMTLLIGTGTTGEASYNVGKVRIRSVNGTRFIVAENSDISWQDNLYLTVINYVDIWTVYPRIIPDPADPENVIFYKDYDIVYDPVTAKQNEILGSFPCAGPHRAAFLSGGSAQLYWSALGTQNVAGEVPTYLWEFEGGTGSSYNTATPGYVTYNTPGHYKTKLTVSTPLGGSDVTYRFVSIYDRENVGGKMPIVKWDMNDLSGSRAEGGYNASIKVWEHIDDIQDNSLVVVFADDWYGSTETSLGGNAEHCSNILFVGYIIKGSIQYNYRDSFVEFSIGSATEIMRQAEGFAISCESVVSPTTWFEIKDMDIHKALYHYLRWHSTVLKVADVQYTGDARKHQYLDTDRESLFDTIDNFLRTAIVGELIADRQGKLWAEIDASAEHDYFSTGTTTMTIDNQDWMDEPTIEERQINEISYLEAGGISYSGPTIGTFAALMSQAPGSAPAYRGKVERLQGLVLTDQAQLNDLTGDLFAYKNSKYNVSMKMAGNYRNIDIAPKEKCLLNVGITDTVRRIQFTNKPFHPITMSWQWQSDKAFLYPNIIFNEITNGIGGATEQIPAETIDVPAVPPSTGFVIPTFTIPPFSIPALWMPTYNAGYITWLPITYTFAVFGDSILINTSDIYHLIAKTGHYLFNCHVTHNVAAAANVGAMLTITARVFASIADWTTNTILYSYKGAPSLYTSRSLYSGWPLTGVVEKVLYLNAGNVVDILMETEDWGSAGAVTYSWAKQYRSLVRLDY